MRSIWSRAVVLRRAVDSGVRICSLHFRSEDFEQHFHVSRSRSEAATEELVVGLGRLRKAPIQSSASLPASPVQSAPPQRKSCYCACAPIALNVEFRRCGTAKTIYENSLIIVKSLPKVNTRPSAHQRRFRAVVPRRSLAVTKPETCCYLFYIASPNETSFEKLQDVPDYIVQAVPLFVVFVILELAFNLLHSKRDRFQIDDGLTSVSQGMLQELSRIFSEGAVLASYVYVYNNYRIVTLPWNSVFTWFFALLAVDFAYYWVHRCGHEMNLAWAGHQVHHSSEFYNLTTALRQSVLQAYFDPVLYMPLALVLSPSAYLVHHQFNRLYQFLIHTEAVQTLGPLEYFLNTPSHHRVHHGRDRYCIDKNYGGTLIIWDRMFGTFEAERCRPAYGLTHPVNTFDPWTLQVHQLQHIWNQVWKLEGIGNKLSAIFKGPGWEPGKPRLGDPNDIPDVSRPVEPYASKTSALCKFYVCAHFTLLILGYVRLNHLKG
ncbi:hypothetical protein HPB47_004599, partial [Ixodes persulcatus]